MTTATKDKKNEKKKDKNNTVKTDAIPMLSSQGEQSWQIIKGLREQIASLRKMVDEHMSILHGEFKSREEEVLQLTSGKFLHRIKSEVAKHTVKSHTRTEIREKDDVD